MKLVKTILLAVDFDDTAEALLAAVTKLAAPFNCEIVLMHAIEPSEQRHQSQDRLEEMVKSRLQEMSAQLSKERIVVSELLIPSGKAASEIAAAAEQHDANLIMIGARGVAANHQFAIGTTTESVIRKASKPVLAVHPSKPFDLGQIVCPIDLSDVSSRGLSNAIRLARVFHSRLHVLTVIQSPSRYHRLDRAWAEWAMKAEVQAVTDAVRELNDYLGRIDFGSVQWERHVERGDAASQIIALAQSIGAGLIIMGSTGRTGLPYVLMGSTAVKVSRQLPCSLLTVKHDQVLKIQLEHNIAGINEAFREGQELLAAGFRHEALTRFERCLELDPHFAHAIEAKADAHERLGHSELACECRKLAQLVREELWGQKVQASVRASHPLYSHRRSF